MAWRRVGVIVSLMSVYFKPFHWAIGWVPEDTTGLEGKPSLRAYGPKGSNSTVDLCGALHLSKAPSALDRGKGAL